MNHVVMFSGGLGSWMTAKRLAEKVDPRDITLLFADVAGRQPPMSCQTCPDSTKGTVMELESPTGIWRRVECPTCHGLGVISLPRSPHVGEDEDTYRFIEAAAADVGADLVTVSDGRDIWQVFKDDRFLGNTRLANCSKFLKQKPCREWLEDCCDPAETIVYVGIDWSEIHRLPAIEKGWAPYPVQAPLTEPPYLDKDQIMQLCRDAGIAIPRLYEAGFPHNNCGGFCVRAGQGQMQRLLDVNPERYLFHEAEEQRLREYLEKDVAVLRDRRGGTTTPLTLRGFRERLGVDPKGFDEYDVGGCGCFVEEEGA